MAFVASVLAALSLCVWVASASAADQHEFDAVLSLTGNCAKSVDDPVSDPSCPYPADHKPRPFNNTCGAATDPLGYLYVASAATPFKGEERIDVFDPEGLFIGELTTVANEVPTQACRIDVDSEGRIYVVGGESDVTLRYTPSSYPPTEVTSYGLPGDFGKGGGAHSGVAVDPSSDHVYIAKSSGGVFEYKPDGELVDSLPSGGDVDVWGETHDVYVSTLEGESRVVKVYDGVSHLLKKTISGVSEGPTFFTFPIAVDQANGDVFVGDILKNKRVNHFCRDGGTGEFEFCEAVEHNFQNANDGSDIAVDGSGASPNPGYLFVTSGATSNAHLYAFAPLEIGPPGVGGEAVFQIGTTAATLEAEVTPNGAETLYRFEYTDAEDFALNGFDNAATVPVPEGSLEANLPATPVSIPVVGLEPGTAYRFRAVATNHCKPGEPEVECVTEGLGGSFTTYMATDPSSDCPNGDARTGPSARLADCRAYELVTTPNANGKVPVWAAGSTAFDISLAAPSGTSLMFGSETGALPGFDGNGFIDVYRAERGPAGWESGTVSPSSIQSRLPKPLSASPDHGYALWEVYQGYGGTLEIPGGTIVANYLRNPDGAFVLVGRAEPGFVDDPDAVAHWITPDAGHVIFVSGEGSAPGVQLAANAPPAPRSAVYDRTPAGLRVVSLLPGDVTPAGDADYQGASADGNAVAFSIGTAMYVRLDNATTAKVVEGAATFAGLSEDGTRVFYVQGGDLFSFATDTEVATKIGSGGESAPVNISADGSHAYFVSPKQLDGSEGTVGEGNLYAWDESSSATHFIGTLDSNDVSGPVNLLRWIPDPGTGVGAATHAGSAVDPSRSTPDGSVLVFESHADLVPPYESNGHSQVYRYDADAESLLCISCNPTQLPAGSDAQLQSHNVNDPFSPLGATAPIANLSSDGDAVFFQSGDRLVPGDTDGLADVYEWRGGRLALISSGQSAAPDYLYGVTPDGGDVFIQTSDGLVPQDTDDGVPSIYDARVEGGFPPSGSENECRGDACQGDPGTFPALPSPGSTALQGSEVTPLRPKPTPCRKGKRRIGRNGRERCVRERRNRGKSSHRRDRGRAR